MDGTGVKEIADLARQAAAGVVKIDGVDYSTAILTDPRTDPLPDPLALTSLAALVSYLQSDGFLIDRNNRGEPELTAVVSVAGPQDVHVFGNVLAPKRKRANYANAKAVLPSITIGMFYPVEQLLIAAQSLFVPSGERDRLIAFLASTKDEIVTSAMDDGASQTIAVKAGIVREGTAKVENPFTIMPFRTFTEVFQPPSPFILRFKKASDGIQAALFEADGGAWRNVAMIAIGEYLEKALEGIPVDVLF
jgi:hypothetical protein